AAAITQHVVDFGNAFLNAVPATAVAAFVGIIVGGAVGYLVSVVRARNIANDVGARYIMLLVPLVSYGVATLPALNANGFIAAFVAGLAYRMARTRTMPERRIAHSELMLVDEVGILTSYFVWFILGGVVVIV